LKRGWVDGSIKRQGSEVDRRDWQLAGEGWRSAQIANRWNVINSGWDSVLMLPRGAELRLSRNLPVTSGRDIVELLTTYAHAMPDSQADAAARLGALLHG
jgi:hypothetical protein